MEVTEVAKHDVVERQIGGDRRERLGELDATKMDDAGSIGHSWSCGQASRAGRPLTQICGRPARRPSQTVRRENLVNSHASAEVVNEAVGHSHQHG
eukprot:3376287-Prymnesium_polylepis.1